MCFRSRLLVSLILPVLVSTNTFAAAGPQCASVLLSLSRSQSLEWLEQDSPERLSMIRERNGEVLADLKDSQLKQISETLQDSFIKNRVIQTSQLRPGQVLTLRDKGFGKGTELILESKSGKRVLFSNLEEAGNNSVRLLSYSVSPNNKYIVGVYMEKGNIDHFFAKIYSLEQSILHAERIPMMGDAGGKIAWTDPSTFLYQEQRGHEFKINLFNIEKTKDKPAPWAHFIFKTQENLSVVSGKTGDIFLLDGHGGKLKLNLQNSYRDLLGVFGESYLFRTETADGTGVLELIKKGQRKSTILFSRPGQVIISAGVLGKHVWVGHFRGADRHYEILNAEGTSMGDIQTPTGTNILQATWEKPGKILNLEFGSKIKKNSKRFTWDLRTELDVQKIAQAMHKDGDVTYISYIEEVKSADGTIIPMRLTHRSDLVLDGSNPSLVSVYGGFGATGMMHANQYFVMEKAFLEKGGILIAPAVRGGNEFGTAWHESGRGAELKMKTLEDTIAVGKWLAKNKYSTREKIIVRGGSNGGWVAAAAALKSPGTFGLSIPSAGVHDMLGKERLDLDESFKPEYGDATQAGQAALMERFSSIEFTSRKNPTEFFLVTGADDSRVNAVHSYKLIDSLRDQGIKADLFTIKNAGHFAESMAVQNTIGWRTQSIIWAKIFQFAGFEY